MSVYNFKIRNDFSLISGATINPMISSAYTGTQIFDKYHTLYDTKRYANLSIVSGPISPSQPYTKPLNQRRFSILQTPSLGLNTSSTNQDAPEPFVITSGGTIVQPSMLFKNISFPIENNFNEVGQEVDINRWVSKEVKKVINPISNGERVKYLPNIFPTINLKFRFFNKNNNTYDDNTLTSGYESVGFLPNEINVKNSFKKSFFRLYFFDSNDIKNRNLLSTEDLDVFGSNKPEFKLDRIYWFQDDDYFRGNTNNRIIYMEAKFFNAKTGEVVRFFNPPSSQGTPVKMNVLANNNDWRTSKMIILNPSNNNGYYNFQVGTNSGANTNTTITLTQYRLKIQ